MRTLLIGLSGADWKTIDPLLAAGAFPFLSELLAKGVRSDCQSLPPFAPALSWATALTGRRPWRHGVLDDFMPPRVPLLWDHFADAGRRPLTVGWPAWNPSPSRTFIPEAFFRLSGAAALETIPPELAGEIAGLQVNEQSLDPAVMRWLCPALSATSAAHDPKAGRLARAVSILYSIQNTASSLMETEEWDFAAVRLPFPDHFTSDFANHLLSPDTVPLAERERYRDLPRQAARLLDLSLHQLVSSAGDDTQVILFSPHAAGRLGSPGMLLASGNGILAGHRTSSTAILDLAPTILHAAGCQVPSDLDGEIAADWFGQTPPPAQAPAISIQPSAGIAVEDTPHAQASLLLGIDLFESGFPDRALPALQRACDAAPELPLAAYWLARCRFRLGRASEADATSEILHDHAPGSALCRYFLGVLALENGRCHEALPLLREAGEIPQAGTYQAAALLGAGDLLPALRLIEQQLIEAPDALAWYGLAFCRWKFGLHEPAAHAAREAVRLAPDMSEAWKILADALDHLGGRSEEAAIARANIRPSKNASPRPTSADRAGWSHSSPRPENPGPFSYRQPAPGEMHRAHSLLGSPQTPDPSRWRHRVWSLENPHRFAGAAVWREERLGEPASVYLKFLPRHLRAPWADDMLAPLITELRDAGVQSPEFLVSSRDPWADLLGKHGFIWSGCDELWSGIDVRAGQSRLTTSRLKTTSRLVGWQVRALREEDWDTIREWCVGNGFHPEERLSTLKNHLDPEASGVAESADGPEGVLLATRRGMLHVIEFAGGHPARKSRWSLATWLLLERFSNYGGPHPHGDIAALTTCPQRAPFARALAMRFGGRIVDVVHRFRQA